MKVGDILKNNNLGFTLVELLASISILALLTGIVLTSYSKYLKGAKERYFKSQEQAVILSGKEYFTDYRSKLPQVIGEVKSVNLETLYEEKYIDKLKDYNGKECGISTDEATNKVYVEKVSNQKYTYYTIIECNDYKTVITKRDK